MHKSKEYMFWMKANPPTILVILVPTKCISVFQLANVVLQKPFKHELRQAFDSHILDYIIEQLQHTTSKEVKVDTIMKTSRPHLCGWLFIRIEHLQSKVMMKAIKKGWNACGLLQTFQLGFQMATIDVNLKIFYLKRRMNTR